MWDKQLFWKYRKSLKKTGSIVRCCKVPGLQPTVSNITKMLHCRYFLLDFVKFFTTAIVKNTSIAAWYIEISLNSLVWQLSRKTNRPKLYGDWLSAKFSHQKTRWTFGILRSDKVNANFLLTGGNGNNEFHHQSVQNFWCGNFLETHRLRLPETLRKLGGM